jgi:phage shock protein E
MGFFSNLFGSSEASFDVKQLLQQGAVIVDVRTPAEFNSGHIKGSLNIPLDQIGTKIAFLQNKKVPVITVCRSGNRSGAAAGVLKSNGIEVYNGGAWDTLQSQIN